MPLPQLFGKIVQTFHAIVAVDAEAGAGQRDAAPFHRLCAVLEIAVHGALACVEIDRRHPRALVGERDCDVDRRGRLAGAALFVGEDDAVGTM